MKKVFLYLYPIEEFNRIFLFGDSYYKEENREKPFPILNECIEKRYRSQGYDIIYALYPDKNIYGIIPKPNDKIIYTDISFKQASGYNEDGTEKSNDEIKYPNEQFLINQLGQIDEIVIGEFHFGDCVKRVAECCYENDINTLVNLNLTDLFFNLYYQKDYFNIKNYNPERYKLYWKNKLINRYGKDANFIDRKFKNMYGSKVFKFYSEETKERQK